MMQSLDSLNLYPLHYKNNIHIFGKPKKINFIPMFKVFKF